MLGSREGHLSPSQDSLPNTPSWPASCSFQQPQEQAPSRQGGGGQWLIPGLRNKEAMRRTDQRTSGITRGGKSQHPMKGPRNHDMGLHHGSVEQSAYSTVVAAIARWCNHSLVTSRPNVAARTPPSQSASSGSLGPSLKPTVGGGSCETGIPTASVGVHDHVVRQLIFLSSCARGFGRPVSFVRHSHPIPDMAPQIRGSGTCSGLRLRT